MSRKVLIIEDYRAIQENFAFMLKAKLAVMGIELLQARNAEEARDHFYAGISDFIVISFDARFPKKEGGDIGFMGVILVREFVQHAKEGIALIAASNSTDSNMELEAAGCNVVCHTKADLPQIILNIVGLC